jgi:hypothetical protein
MSYVASICFGVCLYHTLLEYNILQQWVAPDVSAALLAGKQRRLAGKLAAGMRCT